MEFSSLLPYAQRVFLSALPGWTSQQPPFKLDLDLIQILELSPELYDYLMSNDLSDVQFLFQEAIAAEMKKAAQEHLEIQICLRITNIPALEAPGALRSVLDLPKPGCERSPLQKLAASLFAKSAPLSYVKSSKFVCIREDCTGKGPASSQEDRFSSKVILEIPEEQIIDYALGLHCPNCGEPLEEELAKREVSTRIRVTFFPDEAFQLSQQRSQGFHAFVNAHDGQELVLGEQYEIIGTVVFQASLSRSDSTKQILECISIKPMTSFSKELSKVYGENVQMAPALYNLYRASSQSPWSFVRTLAYDFASDILPKKSFYSLKLCLLLSLVAGEKTEEEYSGTSKLPILVASEDVSLPNRLLSRALELSERPIVHCHQHMALGTGQGIQTVEAGSLLLAKRGVCYLGDLAKMKKVSIESFRTILEQDRIVFPAPTSKMDGGRSFSSKSFESQPLDSTVWATLSLNTPAVRKDSRRQKAVPSNVSRANFSSSIKPLIDVFGMVFFTDSLEEKQVEDTDLLLSEYLLSQAAGIRNEQSLVHIKDLKMFLLHLRGRPVEMEEESLRLLKKYFVASRRVRGNNMDASGKGTEVPQSALKTLTVLSESHAKLCLHPTVMLPDALMAIRIFEMNMTAQVGYSFLEVEPEPHIGQDQDLEQILGFKFDESMRKFQVRLNSFLATYAPDVTWAEE